MCINKHKFPNKIICNDKRRILYYSSGYTASNHDSSVFSRSTIFHQPSRYFSPGEYLIGDGGYAISPQLITPYKGRQVLQNAESQFNEVLSSARVTVEHVNGILKGRWQSLRGLRLVCKKKEDIQFICDWITCTIILHNLLIDLNDDWAKSDGWEEDDADSNSGEGDGVLSRTGVEKRERLKEKLIEEGIIY